ncbi:hypothetical protein LTR17_000047 [Elasticomyces elasticus]|nr:hypothetical protein LTR17_000047 [Elasticomyces elasticus]
MTIQHALDNSSAGNDGGPVAGRREMVAAMLDRDERDDDSLSSDGSEETKATMSESRTSLFKCQVPSCKHLACLDRGGLHYHSKAVDHSTEHPVTKTEQDLSEHLLNLKAHMDEEAKTYAEDFIWQSRRIKGEDKLRKDQDAKTRCDRCSRCGSVSAWWSSALSSRLRRRRGRPASGGGWCDGAAEKHKIYEGSDKEAGSEVARRRVRVASISERSRRSIMDMLLLLVMLAGVLRPRSARCRLPFAVGQACTPDTGGMEKSLRPPGRRAH